jgi:hypothetical protein
LLHDDVHIRFLLILKKQIGDGGKDILKSAKIMPLPLDGDDEL